MARPTAVHPQRSREFHVAQTWATAVGGAPRLVLVSADPGRGAALARTLESAGYEVRLCGGPSPSRPCPMAVEGRCSLVGGADAVVLCGAVAAAPDPGLVRLLGEHYPGVPAVVASADGVEVDQVSTPAWVTDLLDRLAEVVPAPPPKSVGDGGGPNRARSHLALLALAHDVQDAAIRGDRDAVLRGLRELRVDLERHTAGEAEEHAFAHCSIPVRDTIVAGQRRLMERLDELQGLVELPDSGVSRTTARLVRAWRDLLRRQARLETIASLGGPGRS